MKLHHYNNFHIVFSDNHILKTIILSHEKYNSLEDKRLQEFHIIITDNHILYHEEYISLEDKSLQESHMSKTKLKIYDTTSMLA